MCLCDIVCAREREKEEDLQQHRFGTKFARASCCKEREEVRLGKEDLERASERESQRVCVCVDVRPQESDTVLFVCVCASDRGSVCGREGEGERKFERARENERATVSTSER